MLHSVCTGSSKPRAGMVSTPRYSRSMLDAGVFEAGSGPGSASSVGRLSALSAGSSVSDTAAMLWLWRSWLTAEAA